MSTKKTTFALSLSSLLSSICFHYDVAQERKRRKRGVLEGKARQREMERKAVRKGGRDEEVNKGKGSRFTNSYSMLE